VIDLSGRDDRADRAKLVESEAAAVIDAKLVNK
jgi:hypothetical protein